MHDSGFRDAKRPTANGPEPCWYGRKEDPESQDVGVAVSCVFQVRPPSPRHIPRSLRCRICKDASKKFCPSCGNPTLLRASVTISSPSASSDAPAMQVHLKKNFQYRTRGTIYSIPAPKPGSAKTGSGEGLILREDQTEYMRAMKRRTLMSADGINKIFIGTVVHQCAPSFTYIYVPRLLFMKRLFWKDIHHLLGFPVPSAYSLSISRAASSWRTCTKYWRR